MVTLPVIQRLEVKDYGLFPGDPPGSGIVQTFDPGPTLIVGTNGLGKTTLLMTILRALTGPFDLTGQGAMGEMSVSLPDRAVKLRPKSLSFFKQRVADDARDATVRLTAAFGPHLVRITRGLSDLSLIEFQIDGEVASTARRKGRREELYQVALAELMGLGSFVDVLLILHHVVLFPEGRPGALWDKNAQRQILRALFLDKSDAVRVAELERLVQSVDSKARNIHAHISATEAELKRVRQEEAGSNATASQLKVEQELLEAELRDKHRLEERLEELEEERQAVRLQHEKAKIASEEAAGAEERLKYSALANLYPTMEEASRLVVARIMTQAKCLVCDAHVEDRRREIEDLLSKGFCPACGAPPEEQHSVAGNYEIERTRLDTAREELQVANREKSSSGKRLSEVAKTLKETLSKVMELHLSIEQHQARNRQLKARLPDSLTSHEIEHTLTTLRRQHLESKTELARHVHDLATLLDAKEDVIRSQADSVTGKFADLMNRLLAESARLVEVKLKPRYTQADAPGGRRLQFPAYEAEMVAANRSGFVRRQDTTDVSESQQELIDLAFRLSLVHVAAPRGAATFIMETPEASLDGVAMDRVGRTLSEFGASSGNRLIVTSNLSNAGVISSILGGPSRSENETKRRHGRLLNLLSVAAPNRALSQDRDVYQTLLDKAVQGTAE